MDLSPKSSYRFFIMESALHVSGKQQGELPSSQEYLDSSISLVSMDAMGDSLDCAIWTRLI